ncbi:hypothetical protein RND81_11G060600 [Saponaria officinalis]|uniref:AP2/ERF domain-containing protein n=1 Tax=Saponaria officinalis TaxID=3572 RepID=A0AAW1HII7_SAPOF
MMKMVGFEESCNGKEVETCNGVSEVKKKFVVVSKNGNRWQARARDPKLKCDVYLRCYSTPEEAAVVVKKKKLEFEEIYKGEDCLGMNSFKGYFNGVKLPFGVTRDNGRWRVKVWHPKLKCDISGGSYKTCEEAAVVAEAKRAEFHDLQEPKNVKAATVAVKKRAEIRERNERESEVPRGVRRIQSGKWVARIRDPVAKTRRLGTYNTFDEAIRAFNKKKDLLAEKMTRDVFDGSGFTCTDKPGSKTNEDNSPTLLLGAENFNNDAVCDESRCGGTDTLGKLGHGLVHSSLTSVFDVKNSNSASASGKTCGLDFDRAVSLGFIDEYGQLQGEFSKFDEPMWCAADEDRIAPMKLLK